MTIEYLKAQAVNEWKLHNGENYPPAWFIRLIESLLAAQTTEVIEKIEGLKLGSVPSMVVDGIALDEYRRAANRVVEDYDSHIDSLIQDLKHTHQSQ